MKNKFQQYSENKYLGYLGLSQSKFFLLIGYISGIISLVLFVGFYQMFVAGVSNDNLSDSDTIREKGAKFTSPLLECSDTKPLPIQKMSKLEPKLNAIVKEGWDENGVETSLYWRDLSNGGWLEAGSKDVYRPASLMKLVTLIAAFKKVDSNLDYENSEVVVDGRISNEFKQNIVTGQPELEEGSNVTISNLISRVAIDSDNYANDLLIKNVGADLMNAVLSDLGMPPFTAPTDYKISPRIYSRFLRILYNATYLSKSSSEELLKLLSQSKFNKGLRAGVPAGVTIASKFGERVVDENGKKIYQLHDCGIIYSTHPYILCVMTQGNSFDMLYSKISSISKVIYEATK
ncbi:MAG: serine hydrolase [Patescibacteria group bacterium]